MALGFGFRRPVALPECCDRCGEPGMVRYAKDVVVDLSDLGVEVKRLDLIVCEFHKNLNGAVMTAQGFVPVEIAR